MFENFYLKIELDELAFMPKRALPGDAGLDFFSPIDFTINPRSDILIPTGVKVEFPKGFALVFKEKSGLATKKKLTLGAAVVDSEYRGVVHVHLFNNSDDSVSFKRGDKIAQGLIYPVWDGEPEKVVEVDKNTKRGSGGFGSTGK